MKEKNNDQRTEQETEKEWADCCGVSVKLLRRAKRICEAAPDLIDQMTDGSLSIWKAEQELRRRKFEKENVLNSNVEAMEEKQQRRATPKEREATRIHRSMLGPHTQTRNVEITEHEFRLLEYIAWQASAYRQSHPDQGKFKHWRVTEEICKVLVDALCDNGNGWWPNVERELSAELWTAVSDRLNGNTFKNEDGHILHTEGHERYLAEKKASWERALAAVRNSEKLKTEDLGDE